uniref:Uncharacterized protein n=1 Tax=Anguilla anguilla TaxID=7936 RepID=A0A0E9PUH6_ANGAN
MNLPDPFMSISLNKFTLPVCVRVSACVVCVSLSRVRLTCLACHFSSVTVVLCR